MVSDTNDDEGYVYALENKAFPGYIKIGQTKDVAPSWGYYLTL